MKFLADYKMQASRRFQPAVDRAVRCVVCCGESLFIDDVVHAEPFIDPSVMGRTIYAVREVVHHVRMYCR